LNWKKKRIIMNTDLRRLNMVVEDRDQAATKAFSEKVMRDVAGWLASLMACIGDRLGLFACLAQGEATSEELAERAQISERYAREWLGAMACAGYLDYDPTSKRFCLPPAHVPVLAQEDGLFFVGGLLQGTFGALPALGQLLAAFRSGEGVPMSAYSADAFEGMARLSNSWFENLLVQKWIPAMPAVQEKLMQGARMADIGCGQGRALLKLAQAYPKAHYCGYDIFAPHVERANADARAAGVADRVRFVQLDAAEGLPEQYDIITTFNMVHDAPDPLKLLQAIRQALAPGGHYICTEVDASDKLEENKGLHGTLFYCSSVLFCMPTSLAFQGAGLGTLGLPESRLREFCLKAGFRDLRRLPVEAPMNAFYDITA